MMSALRRWWHRLWWGARPPADRRFTIHKVQRLTSQMPGLRSTICDGQGLWVAVGNDGVDSCILTSPEGVTWTERR